jgi:ribosome-associated toxin RatA of RatAB toxin-antitoxin module
MCSKTLNVFLLSHRPVNQDALPSFPHAPSAENALTSQGPIPEDQLSETVQVSTEKLQGRARRILATVVIPQPVEQVWRILTDYERLAEFIPNLTESRRLAHPGEGIRLEQIGAQCFLNVKICARVVLDMLEHFPYQLDFSMVEGDFKQFQGAWRLEPVQDARQHATILSYELLVQPPRAMPVALIEHHIRHNLTQNLLAIRHQAMTVMA